MLRPNLVIRQRRIAAVIAPLAFALSMGVSHQALADCGVIAPPQGVAVVCSGIAEIDSAINVDATLPGTLPTVAVSTGTNLASGLATSANWYVGVQLVGVSGTELEVEELAGTPTPSTIFIHLDSVTSTTNTRQLMGIMSTQSGAELAIENEGVITIEHAGVGAAFGIAAQQTADDINAPEAMTIENEGTISVERTASTFTITTNTSASVQARVLDATATLLTAANVGIAAGLFSNEGTEEFQVFNEGTIEAKGKLAFGIYTISSSSTIVNDGTITSDSVAISGIAEVGPELEDGKNTTTIGAMTQ